MSADKFYDLVQQLRESRYIEFKRSTSWEDAGFRAKLVKSILAMSNIRDGGYIILGVERQDDDTYLLTGMEESDAKTYFQDEIDSWVAKYADPYAALTLYRASVNEGVFLVVAVEEFDELPVICKKDGQELFEGRIYTRTRRKAESSCNIRHAEMREIIEMAVEKSTRKLLQRLPASLLTGLTPDANDLFDSELHDLGLKIDD